jgi:hypothetical protein
MQLTTLQRSSNPLKPKNFLGRLAGKKINFPTSHGGKIELASIALVARTSYVATTTERASLYFNEALGGQMSEVCPVALRPLAFCIALLKISFPRWHVTEFSDQWEARKMSLPKAEKLIFKSTHGLYGSECYASALVLILAFSIALGGF